MKQGCSMLVTPVKMMVKTPERTLLSLKDNINVNSLSRSKNSRPADSDDNIMPREIPLSLCIQVLLDEKWQNGLKKQHLYLLLRQEFHELHQLLDLSKV